MPSQQSGQPLLISSLRGGLNDNDPPLILGDDNCTIAENVEFFYSSAGERRLGCSQIADLPSFLSSQQAVTWMGRHYPDNNVADAEFWALGQNLSGSSNALGRRTTTGWAQISPYDSIISTSGYGHRISAVSLHGKFFFAYKSTADLLHVFDGTSLRQTGLPAPGAIAVTDTGVGSFSGARYYRVRFIVVSSGTILLRSEPSGVATLSPSGSGIGALITRSGSLGLGETNWELEASTDNANFYRIATLPMSTTTYTDSVAFNTGYLNSGGTISEDLTAYTRIPSGKFLCVDNDRLLIAGSWTNPLYGSRVWWTPTQANTGVGNDERLDMTVNPYMDLDGYAGGEITAMSQAVNGYLYVFKWGHIYKLVRTGQLTQAYSAVPMTTQRGALPGSLVEAVDQTGSPALYFLDPRVGPMRIGQYGMEWCGRDLRTTWRRVNLSATVPACGVYYQNKNQVHFWIAVDGADHPNMKIILQCNETRSYSLQSYGSATEGARRGWSTTAKGDRISDVHCALMFDDNVDSVGARSQNLVPYIGKEQWTVNNAVMTNFIQRCDTGTVDAQSSVDDVGSYYYATIQTKPYLPTGLLSMHGLMAGSLLASTIVAPTNNVYIDAIKNFGEESIRYAVDMTQQTDETMFVKKLDNVTMSEIRAIQFQFGDLNTEVTPTTSWRLHAFAAKVSPQQTQ